MRDSLQSRDREMESRIYAFHMARRLFRIRRERSISNPKKTPDSHARAHNTADGQVANKRRVGGRRTPRNLPRIRSELYKITPIGTAQKAIRSLITDIRVFVRGRIARNPAVPQPGLIGPFVRVLRLPRPHDPPTRLLVCDHLSFPRLPQEHLVALTERCAGPSNPLAAADAARSRARSVVTRADAPSVEVPRTVRHGGCPLPNDGPQLVFVKVLEVVALTARSGYVLRLRLRYALVGQAMSPKRS